jgi:hypothetical protein
MGGRDRVASLCGGQGGMAAEPRRLLRASAIGGLVAWIVVAAPVLAIPPDNPGPAAIQFSINSGSNVKSISPYIYGMNSFFNGLPTGTHSGPAIALERLGGNRWTGYNWETNASNAGSDYFHVNDLYLVNYQPNTPPGQAVKPSLDNAVTHNRAVLVTVPIAGYVSADTLGEADPVGPDETAPSPRWKQLVAKKSTVDPTPLLLTPNKTDNFVFTDEFVHWVEATKHPSVATFYSLDNEPDLWDSTHPYLYPNNPTFADVKNKTIAHASAIKDVAPGALVFGPGSYGWHGFRTLQDAPDYTSSPSHPGNADLDFVEWYLNELRIEEIAQGRKLVDVLDLHWYPEATGGGTRITFGGANNNSAAVVEARVQAPRSLWDPTYTETSWITEFSTNGPIQLLNRVQADIDTFNPGTKLAITEYNYGGGNHISGAIAQADVLGVFGREGLFAATWWNIEGSTMAAAPFTYAAFNMYRNYDGAGGTFADTSIAADTSNIANSAVYASLDSSDPNRMVVVAINRTASDQTTGLAVTHDRVFDHAEVYRLTGASTNISRLADIEFNLLNAFQFTMPAYSVTTFVLISDGLPGDYNRDGLVDAADYTVWRNSFGQTGNVPADGNEDNIVDDKDYTLWKSHYGLAESNGSASLARVPEPTTLALILLAACGLAPRQSPRRPKR